MIERRAADIAAALLPVIGNEETREVYAGMD